MKSQTVLGSSELARLVGVSPDTLRLYERKGLLPAPARAANGYRRYSREAVERIRLIRSALTIGFTLEELEPILKLRDAGGAPCRRVRDLAERKMRNLELRIEELRGLRDQLRKVLAKWDHSLGQTRPNGRAGLLQSLVDSERKPTSRLPPHLLAAITKEAGR
ncbi:MAG TPA: heavy metal-responsive transcriptional regulator [Terriglobales bacterium]|nr:heavy metal-responsive transcriptional regulator [Terriglobales bacterium]